MPAPWRGSLVVEPARRSDGRMTACIRLGRERAQISFTTPGLAPIETDDPYLPIALLLGMKTRRRVVLEGPVSAPLLASVHAVQRDLAAWYPRLARPRVVARHPVPSPAARGRGAATFFSGGLDSFYTALAHAESLTHLLFVHGFDLRLEDVALRERVLGRTRLAADGLGKPLVQVETDLRDFSDVRADWAWFSHAGLIAVALLVSPHFEEILVPATLAVAHRPEALEGPVDSETWRGGLARIRSDGAEATRPEKARKVAEHPAARAHLRVCWENRGGAYNCGRCPKCLRTLLNLEAAGVAGCFDTFPTRLDPASIDDLPVATRSDRQMLEESLWMLEAEGANPALADRLRRRLARGSGEH